MTSSFFHHHQNFSLYNNSLWGMGWRVESCNTVGSRCFLGEALFWDSCLLSFYHHHQHFSLYNNSLWGWVGEWRAVTQLVQGVSWVRHCSGTYVSCPFSPRLEVKAVKRSSFIRAISTASYQFIIPVICLVVFTTYVMTDHSLTTKKLFVVLGLFNLSRALLTIFFPTAVMGLKVASVSEKRLQVSWSLKIQLLSAVRTILYSKRNIYCLSSYNHAV